MRLRVICTRLMYSSAFTQVLEKMQQRSRSGIIDGEVLQHAAAGRGAGDMRLVDAERVQQRDRVARDQPASYSRVRRLVAVARAAVVEGDAAIALGELRDLEFPGIEQPDQSRDEQEGRPLPALLEFSVMLADIDPSGIRFATLRS